jgi:hypothetical protein
MKGCAIRRSRGIAVLNVSSLVLNLPWPSDHVCNGGAWTIPARPGEASSEARSARQSFPKEIFPDFSREILEKNPAILEKNPVLLSRGQLLDVRLGGGCDVWAAHLCYSPLRATKPTSVWARTLVPRVE